MSYSFTVITCYSALKESCFIVNIPKNIAQQLARIRTQFEELPETNLIDIILFFSVTDGQNRALTFITKASDFDMAWQQGESELQIIIETYQYTSLWLRVEIVQAVKKLTLAQYEQHLIKVKRSYSRKGISFDAEFSLAITEQELNANALLYNGDKVTYAKINKDNFYAFFNWRFPNEALPNFNDKTISIYIFTTIGYFDDGDLTYEIESHGRNTGYRKIESLTAPLVQQLVESASNYLAHEVNISGQFTYGYFPCFGRKINAYNNLRHASSTYAMIEAYDLNPSHKLKDAINRSIKYLVSKLIKIKPLPDQSNAAFLVDRNDEIKLGGNAVSILALSQYSKTFNTTQFYPLMEQLAQGIMLMQNSKTGQFVHVLNASDLSVKEAFRIIYYDGEAAFALIRLYELTHNERWINAVVKAFDYFIEAEHWKSHDHWLSYCVNELTRYKPEEKYFKFGIDNVQDHLDFIINRITTFPTLLELMMASQEMLSRLKAGKQHRHLLANLDLDQFYQALRTRAEYLINGYFWPEMAMFFAEPDSIVGAFFIRHHSFRVRIDDVEHYLSGLIAYHYYLTNNIPEVQTNKAPEGALLVGQ